MDDSRFLRVAGRSRAADGAVIAWSVAEGSRGRRWRAMATRSGSGTHVLLLQAVLLEVDPAGRIARLELTTPAGMLTLHPESDQREIHGNVVATDGSVRPLAFPWSADHEIDIVGRPIAMAVALHRRRAVLAVGAEAAIPFLAIDTSLGVQIDVRRVVRLDVDRWAVHDASGAPAGELVVDARGLPAAEAPGHSRTESLPPRPAGPPRAPRSAPAGRSRGRSVDNARRSAPRVAKLVDNPIASVETGAVS